MTVSLTGPSLGERVLCLYELAELIIRYLEDDILSLSALHHVNRSLYVSTLPGLFRHAFLKAVPSNNFWSTSLPKHYLYPSAAGPRICLSTTGTQVADLDLLRHVRFLDVHSWSSSTVLKLFGGRRLQVIRVLSPHSNSAVQCRLGGGLPLVVDKAIYFINAGLSHIDSTPIPTAPLSIAIAASVVVVNFAWITNASSLAATVTCPLNIGKARKLILCIGTLSHPLGYIPSFRFGLLHLLRRIVSPSKRLPPLTVVGLEQLDRQPMSIQAAFRHEALTLFRCIGCPFHDCPGFKTTEPARKVAHVIEFLTYEEYLAGLSPEDVRLHTIDAPGAMIQPLIQL